MGRPALRFGYAVEHGLNYFSRSHKHFHPKEPMSAGDRTFTRNILCLYYNRDLRPRRIKQNRKTGGVVLLDFWHELATRQFRGGETFFMKGEGIG